MLKKYFLISLLLFLLNTLQIFSQQIKSNGVTNSENINFYPNPVTNGKIFIVTKLNLTKEISIYDVLGKKVLSSVQTSKELNISSLVPGIYLIKIKEGDESQTRKLIIK